MMKPLLKCLTLAGVLMSGAFIEVLLSTRSEAAIADCPPAILSPAARAAAIAEDRDKAALLVARGQDIDRRALALAERRQKEDASLLALGAGIDPVGSEDERAEKAEIEKLLEAWKADREALLSDVRRHRASVPDIDQCRVTTPNSSSIQNTLEKLRQQMAQPAPRPPPPPPPPPGIRPGNDTAALSSAERGAIGDHVRECWTPDAGALDMNKQRVLLTVTTDANGVARTAQVAGDDIERMGDPKFRAFAERTIRALMNPRCSTLPLPNNVLGRVSVLTFRFSP